MSVHCDPRPRRPLVAARSLALVVALVRNTELNVPPRHPLLARHEVIHPDGRQFLLYGDVDDATLAALGTPTRRLRPGPVPAAPPLRPTHGRVDPRVAGAQRATEHDDHG